MIGVRSEEEWEDSQKRNREHYEHAIQKHKTFINVNPEINPKKAEVTLALTRKNLSRANKRKSRDFFDVLDCEVSEMVLEIATGNKSRAVEEARDCIAVLERIIDWMEGRTIPSAEEGDKKLIKN